MSEIINGRIETTTLGPADGPVFSFELQCKTVHGMIRVGGITLDAPQNSKHPADRFLGRKPTALIGAFICDILRVTGSRQWEEVPGAHIRIRYNDGKIVAIGHVINDEWMWFQDVIDWYHQQQEGK